MNTVQQFCICNGMQSGYIPIIIILIQFYADLYIVGYFFHQFKAGLRLMGIDSDVVRGGDDIRNQRDILHTVRVPF